MDDFGKMYKSRLKYAIENAKPTFAGHFIVTGWGCGSGGCNTGAVINAKTGKAIPWPVGLSSVYPLKPEFENENGQEHIYKLNSRLMIFAGNLDGASKGDGGDTVEFYEIKNNKFIFIKSKPYGKAKRESVKLKTVENTCIELYQAWVLNKGIEAVCNYSPLLSIKLGLVAKASCGDLIPEERAKNLAEPVLVALRKDYSEMGEELFCERARPGYEDLLDVITNGK